MCKWRKGSERARCCVPRSNGSPARRRFRSLRGVCVAVSCSRSQTTDGTVSTGLALSTVSITVCNRSNKAITREIFFFGSIRGPFRF